MTIATIIDGVIGNEGGYTNNPSMIAEAIDLALAEQSTQYAAEPLVGPNRRQYQCAAPNCTRQGCAAGYCNAHYMRVRAGKDLATPILNRRRSRICIDCGAPTNGKGGWHRCSKHYKSARYAIIKKVAAGILGGCCSSCKERFPLAVYDFHHIGSKTDSPSNLMANASVIEIAEELSRCVLLCANCHRMEHSK